MKIGQILLIMMVLSSLGAQTADTLRTLAMPQFANPFYNAFSRNYLGTEAAGRGYTGAAIAGNTSNFLVNPATCQPDSTRFFVELNIKPPITAEGYIYESRYSSPIPFSLAGVSIPFGTKFSAALAYNMPRSIVLDDYSIEISMGNEIVTRYPKYYLHQFSGAVSYKANDRWQLGLSLHNQIHYLDDVVYLRTYERIRDYRYALRIQPGVLYSNNGLSLGVSMHPESKIDWDLKYGKYDTVLPMEATGGLSYQTGLLRLSADASWEQYSAIDKKYSDKLSIHAGLERTENKTTYRLGYFYTPNVYKGIVIIPSNTTASADTSIFWDAVATSVPIADNEQHFLTGGLGYQFKDGSLNLAFMQTIVGETKQTQINLSLSIYLNSFKRKNFLYHE